MHGSFSGFARGGKRQQTIKLKLRIGCVHAESLSDSDATLCSLLQRMQPAADAEIYLYSVSAITLFIAPDQLSQELREKLIPYLTHETKKGGRQCNLSDYHC
jgi:hypothetical protein